MTDGHKNQNDAPDEDWAMSEPESPLKTEFQAKSIDEKAASLYAPPDTGDLEEWDEIATQDISSSENVSSPAKPLASGQKTTSFIPPQKAFEILEPIASPSMSDEDWGMRSPKFQRNDGWKMPEPVFRISEGEIPTKIRGFSEPKNYATTKLTPIEGNLSDIYEPSNAADDSELITPDFASPEPQLEVAQKGDFEDNHPAEAAEFQAESEKSVDLKKNQSQKWLLIILGLLAAGVFFIILIAVIFGVFFYEAK